MATNFFFQRLEEMQAHYAYSAYTFSFLKSIYGNIKNYKKFHEIDKFIYSI